LAASTTTRRTSTPPVLRAKAPSASRDGASSIPARAARGAILVGMALWVAWWAPGSPVAVPVAPFSLNLATPVAVDVEPELETSSALSSSGSTPTTPRDQGIPPALECPPAPRKRPRA